MIRIHLFLDQLSHVPRRASDLDPSLAPAFARPAFAPLRRRAFVDARRGARGRANGGRGWSRARANGSPGTRAGTTRATRPGSGRGDARARASERDAVDAREMVEAAGEAMASDEAEIEAVVRATCLLYTSPSPRDS